MKEDIPNDAVKQSQPFNGIWKNMVYDQGRQFIAFYTVEFKHNTDKVFQGKVLSTENPGTAPHNLNHDFELSGIIINEKQVTISTVAGNYLATDQLEWKDRSLDGKWFDSSKSGGFSQWFKVQKIK